MRYHHDTHFAGYTKNLNSVVSDILADINTASKLFPPSPIKITDDESLKAALQPANMAVLPVQFKDRLRNNGGGYLNHKQFFYIMSGQPTELFPKSPLGMAINKEYGSFDSFKTDFLGTAASLFGSGFTWLVMDDGGQLSIVKTPNQDNPVMMGLTPILPCDCWEHAWYSQYGPAKKDYFEQWWQTIDWKKVNKIYVSAKKA